MKCPHLNNQGWCAGVFRCEGVDGCMTGQRLTGSDDMNVQNVAEMTETTEVH